MALYRTFDNTSSSATAATSSSNGKNEETFPVLDFREIEYVRDVARGGMAEISLYKWTKRGFPPLIVIKSLFRNTISGSEKIHLRSEMSILNKLEHPHIVQMFGIVETDRDFGLAMEYLQFGSYRKFFGVIRENFGRSPERERSMVPVKIRILSEVIDGMMYLHSIRPQKVLHLDLKSDNVLLDRKLHAKICDFGLSKMSTLTSLRRRTTVHQGSVGGTPGYIAPERLRDAKKKPTSKADVYAFGILQWEILTDRTPYEEIDCGTDYTLLTHHILQGLRPEESFVPDDFPEELVGMMRQCWLSEPEGRPTFLELQEQLVSLKTRVPRFEAQALTSAEEILNKWRSVPESSTSNGATAPKSPRATSGPYQPLTPLSRIMRERHASSLPELHGNMTLKQHTSESSNQLDQNQDQAVHLETDLLIPRYVHEKKLISWWKILLIVVALAVVVIVGVVVWSNKDHHQSPTKCPNVNSPKHGNVTCTGGDTVNMKCTFSCTSGYEIAGARVITCTGGKWNEEPPICEAVCDPLSPVAHANVTCTNKYFVNSTCSFSCQDNHLIQGKSTLTCQQDRYWSDEEPSCVCPICKLGNSCQYSIRWKDVSDALSSMTPYGTIVTSYEGKMIICSTNMHGFVKWSGTCSDKDSGISVKCTDYESASGASKHAASQLIRNLVSQGKYIEPCDSQEMETGC